MAQPHSFCDAWSSWYCPRRCLDKYPASLKAWLSPSLLCEYEGCLLETHVAEENVGSVLASTLPGWKMDSNYCCSDLGRIWIVWDPSVSVLVFKKTDQLIICSTKLPNLNQSFAVAFVYGRNTEIERRLLWEDITTLANSTPLSDTPWLLVGDFNQIAATNEHFSIIHTSFSMRGDSDHAPCIISIDNMPGRSKKCFKYFSFLSSHTSYLPSLSEAWNDDIAVGSHMFSLGQRLKAAKSCCQSFNRQRFSNIQQRTDQALSQLEDLQISLLTSPTDSLFRAEHVARKKWDFYAAAALESFYRQKSRFRWLHEGDANTRFFHRAVIAHHANNLIKFLRGPDDVRVENVDQIKGMVVAYYTHLLGTPSDIMSPFSVDSIRGLHPFRCDSSLAIKLTAIPTEAEITQILFSMPRNKAPGPDGFPVEFFVEAWPVVKDCTVAAVREFFLTGHLLRRFNATAITLIPKVAGADQLTQFRPIACCTTIYKVITRLISKRLKLFIHQAVQNNQVGFIKGRLLCENVLLASELVDNFQAEGITSRGCLQVDLTKAYDNVNWDFLINDFLINILKALDLPPMFINWIWMCISTPSYSIAFNGELIGFFEGKKGIRQGDPMSSHLFVLVMDILAKSLDRGAVNGLFSLHPKCLAPMITHLSFADDVLIFCDGAESSIAGILNILEFRNGSGLGINRQKTALLLDGGDFERSRILAAGFGVTHGSLPVRYLGVPLTAQKMKKQDYQPLLDNINLRFTAWTARHLSFAGRLQLLKSVIYSTINFWASIFILPNQCLLKLEQMCNAFLWTGAPNSARGAKISWDIVCSSKESGGLGLRRLSSWNKVLALKLLWLLFTAAGSLWVSWVRVNLIGGRNFWDLNSSLAGSWIWRNLCKLRPIARPFLYCEIGSGVTASFWHDNWTGHGPLLDLAGINGPQLSGLPYNAVVRDALRGRDWWIASSRSRNPVIVMLKRCLPDALNVFECQHDDSYLWKLDNHAPSNKFSTANTWQALHPSPISVPWHKAVWFKDRVPKHAFICWVVTWNRLHTRDRLARWGLPIPKVCVLCNDLAESRDHLFFQCRFSSDIWGFFTAAARLNPPSQFMNCLTWLLSASRDKNLSLIIKHIFQATIYFIWKERNLRIHSGVARHCNLIIKEIQLIVRARLDPLSRAQSSLQPGSSLLCSWFGLFQTSPPLL
ncbi:Endonuclease/exonuclease/phosphatase superfamily [Arabidopsis thaliana x Arabidopsis arenosa]|uniref:Endonuclease/exonuclease/phosphatase superfamily n=1 Tax=Arabidopsis thaliana x Arabidopsis arenosa TaxID=1240361 RepID=A0A8T2B172_9BRAS|nr:Endonuclease/exonuclease/phosphatase superfamily [Arabidopsis thaliana x Arabidopsis arenosa]